MTKKIWFIICILTLLTLAFLAGITLNPLTGDAESFQTLKIEAGAAINYYPTQTSSKAEVMRYITNSALQIGIDPAIPLCIAKQESNFNPLAKNAYSSASGLFQFTSKTWITTRNDMGVDNSLILRFNPVDNIDTALWKIQHGGINAWNLESYCWK